MPFVHVCCKVKIHMKLCIEIFSSLLLTGNNHGKLKILEVYVGEGFHFLYGLQAHWQFDIC